MNRQDEEVITLMENLPCRLDRFWKARLLKPHHSLEEFAINLKFCICDHSGEDCNSILAILQERNLLESYIDK